MKGLVVYCIFQEEVLAHFLVAQRNLLSIKKHPLWNNVLKCMLVRIFCNVLFVGNWKRYLKTSILATLKCLKLC